MKNFKTIYKTGKKNHEFGNIKIKKQKFYQYK